MTSTTPTLTSSSPDHPSSSPITLLQLTWGRQSGRDSNITRSTPIGTLICTSSNLSASSVLRSTWPKMSSEVTLFPSCLRPSATPLSLASERLRRDLRGAERPAASPKSLLLAARTSADLSTRRSANLWSTWERWEGEGGRGRRREGEGRGVISCSSSPDHNL